MDTIQKARVCYDLKFSPENQPSVQNNGCGKSDDDDLHSNIYVALKSIPSAVNLFTNGCIFDSLINSLRGCVSKEKEVVLVARGYKCLERYFRLLIDQPWKPEYRILKTYGGYYQTKIKSVISNAEAIFQLAGYVVERNNTLVYKRLDVDKQQLISFSFECFVASKICDKIAEQFNILKTVGMSLDDAIYEILKKAWPREHFREKSLPPSSPSSSSKVLLSSGVMSRDFMSNGNGIRKPYLKEVIYPTEPSPVYDINVRLENPEKSLGNFKYKTSSDAHMPFMDEAEHHPKLSQATPDEHMRESLRFVQQNIKTGPSSEDWKPHQRVPDISNIDSSVTYPPGRPAFRGQRPPDYFKDEGIGLDIPSKSNLGSYPASYILPGLSDQGYVTDPNFSQSRLPLPHQDNVMLSETIYRPPTIAEGKLSQRAGVPQQQSPLPPPIPNRDLKPKLSVKSAVEQSEDMVDGYLAVPGLQVPKTMNGKGFPVHTPSSLGPNVRQPQQLLKSRSLKTESKRIVLDDRISKSMDYTHSQWKCLVCDANNSLSSSTCTTCSKGRCQKPEAKAPKSCRFCTLDNDWTAQTCAACGKALPPQQFTY